MGYAGAVERKAGLLVIGKRVHVKLWKGLQSSGLRSFSVAMAKHVSLTERP